MTDHELPLMGTANTTIVIGQKEISLPIHVIAQHKYEAIIGLDVMRLMGYFEIDFKVGELRLHDNSISFGTEFNHVV